MSTVLAYTSPALGHLFPMTPLLLELRSRGHRVHVRTLAGQVDALRGLGLEASAVDPRVAAIDNDDHRAGNTRAALAEAVATFTARGHFDGPDLAAAVAEVGPDLLVVDINAWGALVAAEASGLPWVTFSPYTPPLRSAGTPPFGPGLRPWPGVLGTVRDGLLRPVVMGVAERVMRPGITELRAASGLAPVRDADAFFRRAPLVLVATAEPFEYHHPDWAPDIVMIGASAWEPPQEPPAWLESVADPIVLVTTSSEFQDDGVLVRTALEALADEPVFVVATMPSGVDESLSVPANARVERFVPHAPVLARASVAVTHGGMGATQKALSLGVPVCAVPFGRDQLEVARRVEVSGAGTRLPVSRLTPRRLRDAVRAARGCADGARRVAEGYAATGGVAAAASTIEQRFLGGALRRSRPPADPGPPGSARPAAPTPRRPRSGVPPTPEPRQPG
jgi:MGT family glycosyltransferase